MLNRPFGDRVGPEAMKTYQISAPLGSHWRPATCAEVDCPNYVNGWRVRVEGLTPQDLHVARTCGRRYVEQHVAADETWLVYEAGQPCFRASQHRARVGRPELYVVRDGDHRGNPRGTEPRRHTRPEFWVEDFAEHQQSLADKMKEG